MTFNLIPTFFYVCLTQERKTWEKNVYVVQENRSPYRKNAFV